MGTNEKPDYGWDGSPQKLALFLLLTLGPGAYLVTLPPVVAKLVGWLLLTAGVSMGALAVIWIYYVKVGKFLRRDHMLASMKWTGSERVLDVGTGRGLLMIGAAQRLTDGKSIGIDIWNADDMLNNSRDRTLKNAELEGVLQKIDLKDCDAQHMAFPDANFDVVLSNLCLHNIVSRAGRENACREIARVLKPNGVAIISDVLFTNLYRRVFEKAGLAVVVERTPLREGCMPHHRTVRAVKSAAV